jgi:hypothetical protein
MRDLEVPPALTAVMQITLREYFSARGCPASEAPGDALVPTSGASQPAPEIRGKTSGEKRAAQFVRMVSHMHTERTFSSVDLRDFESILIFFSEEEIEDLQAAIDGRRRPDLDEERSPKAAEQSDYSPNGVEAVFSEIHIQHPA